MITRLSGVLIDQIAAGEVVVRPASVVKELIENSVDAQARHIIITVANALRDIEVIDDGIGMSPQDAQLALERHATSKIRSFDDLKALGTRGFRGEALPSMAAVSHLTLTTRRSEDLAATQILVDGGQIADERQVGAPPGTRVAVRELYYNTPARLKFLKSAATELGQITRTVVRQALAARSTAFRFLNQKRLFLDLPAPPADQTPLDSLGQRVQHVLGIAAENLLEVDFQKYAVRVQGFVAKPLEARRDRRHQFFFVNGRPISHRALGFSLQQAYEGLIATQRFPVVVLFIELPPEDIDVNVHPTKEEVRFRDEGKASGLLHRAVQEALLAANLVPNVQLPAAGTGNEPRRAQEGARREPAPTDHEMRFQKAGRELSPPRPPYMPPAAPPKPFAKTTEQADDRETPVTPATDPPPAFERHTAPAIPETVEPPAPVDIESALAEISPPRAMGQIANTYIVAQSGENLLLVDQHAAHERLLYLRAGERKGRPSTQPLLVPISVEVRPSDRPLMEELLPILADLGLETEAFGGRTFIVRAVPTMFDQVDVPALIRDLLDDLAGEGKPREDRRLREQVLTRLACHAAIKAGQSLQTQEMQQLIDDLMASRLSFTCPHGRPTMILLTRDQLDRQFKRR